jgi:hypothetical protein
MKARLGSVVGVLLLAACSGNTNDDPGGPAAAGAGGQLGTAGAGPLGGTSSSGGAAGKATGGTPSAAGAASKGGSSGAGGIPADVGSGACHDFSACGGDLVGSWAIGETCFDPELSAAALCPGAVTETSVTGTIEYGADGTMSATVHAEVTTTVPASCAADYGFCAEGGQGNLPDADCETTGAGDCACSDVIDSASNDASYATQGGLLTVVRDGKTNYSYYCRNGDEAWVRGVDQNGRVSVSHMTKL